MNGGWIFLIVLLFLLLGSYGGWILYSRLQASRLGLPPPSLNPFNRTSSSNSAAPFPAPASGGIRGFIDTQVRKFKNRNNRSAVGAYEEAGYAGGNATRGRSRLDPDEAWDTRVGNEAHYEEQELGLHAPEPYHGRETGVDTGYRSPGFANVGGEERGRSRNRDYELEEGLQVDDRNSARNPFGDDAAASLRGVSPRPLDVGQDTSYGGPAVQGHRKNESLDSPTERRSMFRENM